MVAHVSENLFSEYVAQVNAEISLICSCFMKLSHYGLNE